MKTAQSENKRTLGIVTLFFILPILFILSSTGTVFAGTNTYKITNTGITTSECTVTVTMSDGSAASKTILLNKTAEWDSSKCLASMQGTCKIDYGAAYTTVRITTLSGLNICDDAVYVIKWLNADVLNPSFVKQ